MFKLNQNRSLTSGITTLFLICMTSFVVKAGTIVVDSTSATMGTISLRTAIATAISGDTITFSSDIDGDTIHLITQINLDTNLVIIGNGITNTIIDGMDNSRIFEITIGDTVLISGMTVQNGNETEGGAILNAGAMQIVNSRIVDNTAESGGGVQNFDGTAAFTNTIIAGNSATVTGGGVFNQTSDSITFINCIISGNSANSGAGVEHFLGTATFTNCTIAGNSAPSGEGGGVGNRNGTAIFTNTIVAKNIASIGPDIYDQSNGVIIDVGNNLIGDTSDVVELFTTSVLLGQSTAPLDPLFNIDVPMAPSFDGDLNLLCGSPAFNAGTPDTSGLNIGLKDIAGSPRFAINRVDIGAHEFQLSDALAPLVVSSTADSGCGSL